MRLPARCLARLPATPWTLTAENLFLCETRLVPRVSFHPHTPTPTHAHPPTFVCAHARARTHTHSFKWSGPAKDKVIDIHTPLFLVETILFSWGLKSHLFVPLIRLSNLGRTYSTLLYYEHYYSINGFLFGFSGPEARVDLLLQASDFSRGISPVIVFGDIAGEYSWGFFSGISPGKIPVLHGKLHVEIRPKSRTVFLICRRPALFRHLPKYLLQSGRAACFIGSVSTLQGSESANVMSLRRGDEPLRGRAASRATGRVFLR